MESVFLFKVNTVTAHYWLIYAAATVIMTLSMWGIILSHWCPVDRDDIVPLMFQAKAPVSYKVQLGSAV